MAPHRKGFAIPVFLLLAISEDGCSDSGRPLDPGVAMIQSSSLLKRWYFLGWLLILPVLGAGCSDFGTSLDPGVTLISGSWVWQRSEGGFFPNIILPPEGSITIDTFTLHGSYTRVVDGVLVLSARYTMKTQGPYFMVTYSDAHSRDGYPGFHLFDQLVVVEGDTLRLSDYGADLYRHTYARVR